MGTGTRMQKDLLAEQPISKGLVGQKRGVFEVEDTSDGSQKRLKMRDLESIIRSEVKAGSGGSKKAHKDVDFDAKVVDFNVNVDCNVTVTNDDAAACTEGANKLSGSCNGETECNDKKSGGSGLDRKPGFHAIRKCENLKLREDSECRSSVEESDSMRVWKGLKQHNYMSCSREIVPVQLLKRRGRKKGSSNDDVMKKKMEVLRREQVDRFTFLAPPCGLLNGLSPGIINRVRNSKQVLSIIAALVRPERSDHQLSETLPESNVENERERLAVLKISSLVKAVSEDRSCLSTEEPGNSSSVSSLPVEAANVASEWLGLLNRDIKTRLAALARSKARFFAVISMELPLLISREFSSNMDKRNIDAHIGRWSSLFDRTYKSLSEEETRLESWLNQVTELQMLCERGLRRRRLLANNIRSGEVDNSKNDLEIMAAAASIYATCKFL